MSAGKLDLSKFKKIKGDQHSTLLRHEDGHELRLNHQALEPKHLASLKKMPAMMADGGDVTSDIPEQAPNATQAPVVVNVNSAPAMPAIDPEMAAKRQMYNNVVSDNPRTHAGGNTGQGFGPNGEPPAAFSADKWNSAEQQYAQQQQQAALAQQQAAQAAVQQNQARQAAGLPPQPVPNAPAVIPNAGAAPQASPGLGVAQPIAGQPNDPYGNEATYGTYMKGLNEQKAGLAGQAQAEGQLGNQQAALLQKQVDNQQAAQVDLQKHIDAINAERQAVTNDINNHHIDPNHYLASQGTGQRIGTAIGLILGGMGAGLTHGPNYAMQALQANIDRDIDAQKQELGKKQNLLAANTQQFGSLIEGANMTRVMQMDIVSNQLKEAAAKAMDPMAKARALQAAGALDKESSAIVGQTAMRRTLMNGMQSGRVEPARFITAVVPEHLQAAAQKELGEAQGMVKARDSLVNAFDQLTQLNTVGNRIAHAGFEPAAVAALRDPLLAAISKETAGRFTDSDAKMLGTLFPSPGDSAQTLRVKRAQMLKVANEKMNFPLLQSYGISPNTMGRYSAQGASRVQEAPPVIKK